MFFDYSPSMNQTMASISLPLIFLVLLIPPFATSDLKADEEALLAFARKVPHHRKLNWTSQSPCSSWFGVRCTPDKTRVLTLRLPSIGLLGSIPAATLGKLNALEVLSLHSNRLILDLPADILSIPSLHYLYLQNNNLSGDIPRSLSSNLTFLDLSYNSITGEIPMTIQNLTKLTSLFLQNNCLSGSIPDIRLPKLKHLNLSYNNLSGCIPRSLWKFPIDAFLGNPFLCGTPQSRCIEIPPCPAPGSERSRPVLPVVTIAIVAGVLALIILVSVCLFKRKHREDSKESRGMGTLGGGSGRPEECSSGVLEAEKNKLVSFDGCSYNFDLEDLLKASAKALGKGSHGSTYKAVLEDGTTVVVKRLKGVVIGKREFQRHMEMIGRVRQHPNVVPLGAYYYSKEEKLLIYDYAPSGNLFSLLHGNTGGGKPLDWKSRVKISLGVARGIAHIHAEGVGRFIHGNVESNNILLSQELHASVSDYGLVPLMNFATTPSTIVIGYHAPEVIETRKYTHKSDVYSFGVLLLEMLTGKAPLQSPERGVDMDLPHWVQSVVQEEWTSEVFDDNLMRNRHMEKEMVQLLKIAMACAARGPDQRPDMEEVIGMIEGVQYDSDNSSPTENSEGLETS
ncbi:hypothetical protein Cni_G05438 [Canna indica]|uniref:Protein kinase domain-containing protein n=1 Tax=Canna indica TaxID=4628 RepID=A0AAQ3JXS0_9LILI|nr:hypothetical protein Cni_G05438 [Canna indica]